MPVEKRIFDNPHPVDQNNASRRLPVIICLDVSGSMRNNVNDLEEGLKLFLKECRDDQNAKYSCEVLILTFSETITVIQHFDTIENITKNGIPSYGLAANGYTATGEAVRLGLELLDERWKELKHQGVSRYMPWLVVMSDGYPEGSSAQVTAERMAVLDEVSQELAKRVRHKTLSTFSIGIGKFNNEKVMDKLSPGRKSVHLQSYADGSHKFNEFFTWLSSSVGTTSSKAPQEEVPMQPIGSWAEGWGAINTAAATEGNWKKSL